MDANMNGRRSRGRVRVEVTLVVIALITSACTFGHQQTQGTSASGHVTLLIWDFAYTQGQSSGYSHAIDELNKSYMASNPQVTIDYVGIPFGGAYEKYRAAIAAKRGPDIVTMFPGTNAASFTPGLLPLENRLTPEMQKDLINLKESFSPDGHLYALPDTLYGYGWAYNTAVFKAVGLPTTPPQTWGQLLDACQTIADSGRVPMSIGFQDGINLESLLYILSDQMLSPAERQQFTAGDLPVNSPPFVSAVGFVKEMVDHRCFSADAANQTGPEGLAPFLSGQAGMTISGMGFGEVEKGGTLRKAIGDNLGIFTTPPLPGGYTPAGMTDAGVNSGYAIMAYSENADAAWNYVAYLVAPPQQQLIWKQARWFPGSREAFATITSHDPIEQKEIQILENPANFTVYMGFPLQVIAVLYHEAQLFVGGKESAQAMLDKMQAVYAQVMPRLKG